MPDDEQRVISKIRKLLNTHDGAKRISSEHEAEIALNLAFELMQKHHLNMSEVLEAADNDDTDIEIKESNGDSYISPKIPNYLLNIITMVNVLCNTHCVVRRLDVQRSAKRIYTNFIGEKSDLEKAVELYLFFKKVTLRLSNMHAKQTKGNFIRWRSFAEGFTGRLLERAIQQRDSFNDRVADYQTEIDTGQDSFENKLTISQEIAIYNAREKIREKIQEYLNSINSSGAEVNKTSRVNSESYYQGRVAAEAYNLNGQNVRVIESPRKV